MKRCTKVAFSAARQLEREAPSNLDCAGSTGSEDISGATGWLAKAGILERTAVSAEVGEVEDIEAFAEHR